jgi:hypothetical protein
MPGRFAGSAVVTPLSFSSVQGAAPDYMRLLKPAMCAACPLSSEAPPEALKLAAFHTRQKFTTEI